MSTPPAHGRSEASRPPQPEGGRIVELQRKAQRLMSRYVGIVRTVAELRQAESRLEAIVAELDGAAPCGVEVWEARNAAQVGLLIVRSALRRRESRGLHYVLNYPDRVEAERHDTVLVNERAG